MTTERIARLRQAIGGPDLLVVPGVSNTLAARIAEGVGFGCLFQTGAGVANEAFGLPDIGLLGRADLVPIVQRVCGAVQVPVTVDVDDGFPPTKQIEVETTVLIASTNA